MDEIVWVVLGALLAGFASGWAAGRAGVAHLDAYRDWRGLLAPRHWDDGRVASAAAHILRDREGR